MLLNFQITQAGLNAARAADGAGLHLQITHVAIGAGKFTPDASTTAMVDRREVVAVAAVSTLTPDLFRVTARFYSSAYTGALYNVGEIAFWAGNPNSGGVLFAIASSPTANYAVRHSAAADFSPTFSVQISGVPTGSVTVVADPDISVAMALVAEHENDSNPHPGYAFKAHVHAIADVTGLQSALDGKLPLLGTAVAGTKLAAGAKTDLNDMGGLGSGEANFMRYDVGASNKPATRDNANGVLTMISHPSGGGGLYGKQIAFSSDENLYMRNFVNGSFGSWRTILHDANIGTYAPTPTGGGASGTWNISISGNASGSATMVYRGDTPITNVNNAIDNGFYLLTDPGASQTLLTVNAGGSVGPLQIRYDYLGGMWYRSKIDSANWSAWKDVIHNYNIASYVNAYAPTLTGGGASGNWNINVTGSAGSVAWSNVLGRPIGVGSFTNDSGYITADGRAYPRRSDSGGPINFIWSGQGGQPAWLWGGNDGTNMYVYNPSNFSVTYAARSGRLMRRDDSSDYSLQHHWTGSRWRLQGYNGDAYHAPAEVGYADLAGAVASAGHSFSSNGYVVLPGSGIILQWITPGWQHGSEEGELCSFPITFPNACLFAIGGPRSGNLVGQPNLGDAWVQVEWWDRAQCKVWFQHFMDYSAAKMDDGVRALIFAIGY